MRTIVSVTKSGWRVDCPNKVAGAVADCLASFVEERYRIGREFFLADTLEAFNAGTEQVYPSTSYRYLWKLAEMIGKDGLVLEQDGLAPGRGNIRLGVPGLASIPPEPNLFKVGLPFHAFMRPDSMDPKPRQGWMFALFNLREDGNIDQFAPNNLTEDLYPSPAFIVSDRQRQQVTPNRGVNAPSPEAGVLLLVVFQKSYSDWPLLAESPVTIYAADHDHSFERNQLGRFALWVAHERTAGRAALAAARFRCTP